MQSSTLLCESSKVDSYNVVRCIPDRLVSTSIRLTEDINVSVEGFILVDGGDRRLSVGIENSADSPCPIVLLQICGNSDELIAAIDEDSRNSFAEPK